MGFWIKMKTSHDVHIVRYRDLSHRLMNINAVMSAIVPILIPFGQTYQETFLVLAGCKVYIGQCILVAAVICSLIGATSMVIERTGKYHKLAFLYDNECDHVLMEIERFLALA